MRTRSLPLLALASAGALLLAGCASGGDASDDGTPRAGGTLTYATGDAEPTCLDPHVGGNYPQALVSTQYLESLVSKDSEGEVVPWLADSWEESDDGLSWTFTLRDDVSFTDGTPFDAAAVAANVAHLQDPETLSSTGYLALQKVTGVEAVDARTARFDLSEPDSALLESLTQPWLAMESPEALERSQEVNCESPVGTGPFVVESWTKQDRVVLTRNDDYASPPADADHDGPAHLDEVVWRFIPDSAARYAALQAGQVDVIDNVQPDTLVAAEKDDSLDEIDAPRPGAANRIELNSGKAPFDDERVRQAFITGVDVNDGIDSLFFGTADRSYSALSSVEPLAYSDESLFDVDPDAAGELLDEAGWTERDSDGYRTKGGERLSLEFPVSTNQSIPAEQSLFEQIQAGAKQLGIEVVLSPLDLSSWYGALAENDYDLVSAPYTKVGPDVLRILYDTAGITPAPSGYFANLAQLSDPALDQLLTDAAQTSDPDERADLYQQAQQIVLESYTVLPLYDQQNHYLVRSSVTGVRALPPVSAVTLYDASRTD
ncbi:ABC transporter substrate-binding protein [Frigoribacterium sp. VKM Ac-2530]|uniref:ABC transporter substrate-binding protein n=1 Tax=Frigoribacterium sp. VKM Ac-2530 TaxID=2783822 RepID=UPI001889ED85|nr:ABC transporter substrate-binding protein [Frigoribacterium sp. VKM Ac-2530]MBF4579818.1 ABC transporter substrate-binding protein [Frigoribacterium sp. VKM Ac-2530]